MNLKYILFCKLIIFNCLKTGCKKEIREKYFTACMNSFKKMFIFVVGKKSTKVILLEFDNLENFYIFCSLFLLIIIIVTCIYSLIYSVILLAGIDLAVSMYSAPL